MKYGLKCAVIKAGNRTLDKIDIGFEKSVICESHLTNSSHTRTTPLLFIKYLVYSVGC